MPTSHFDFSEKPIPGGTSGFVPALLYAHVPQQIAQEQTGAARNNTEQHTVCQAIPQAAFGWHMQSTKPSTSVSVETRCEDAPQSLARQNARSPRTSSACLRPGARKAHLCPPPSGHHRGLSLRSIIDETCKVRRSCRQLLQSVLQGGLRADMGRR